MKAPRPLLLAIALTAMLTVPSLASADNYKGGSEVIVAVIDTGIRPTHQEFDYQGPTSTTDQFVGWWDFTDTNGPKNWPGPGQAWDTRTATPYDDHGHGTMTASAAVGRNIAPASQKDPSFAPGFKLAVARVCKTGGPLGSECDSGGLVAAVKWATETIGADVISISIGSAAAGPPSISSADGFRRIREAGVLITVSNGNGNGNAGIPGDMGWASNYGNDTSVLSIGVAELTSTFNSFTATSDAEVTAKANSVRMASRTCNTCYTAASGTSFSNPLVAGMAARLMDIAIANGKSASPDSIERLLKYSALDTAVPPTHEGYGQLNATQFALAATHAAAGTLPVRPSPDWSAIYVEQISRTLKHTWTNTGGEFVYGIRPTGAPATTGPNVIGASNTGAGEAEVHTIQLSAGETVTIDLAYAPVDPLFGGRNDVNLYLYDHAGPAYQAGHLAGLSKGGPGDNEHIEFTAERPGTYSIVAVGVTIYRDQPISLSVTSSDSATPGATPAASGYYTVSPFAA